MSARMSFGVAVSVDCALGKTEMHSHSPTPPPLFASITFNKKPSL